MKKEKFNKKIIFRIVLSCLVFCWLILGFSNIVFSAGHSVQVSDKGTWIMLWDMIVGDEGRHLDDIARDEVAKREKSIWSKLFHATLGKALNTIAYDTATWIGSGGDGQKPMFITEGWGEYLTNVADNAAGHFLETLGKENGFMEFNLCEPDFAVKNKIGLGLYRYSKPSAPACIFSKMKKNWEKELHDPNFLSKFQDMFDPTSNDLSIALSLQMKIIAEQGVAIKYETKNRDETKGWLDLRGIDGLRKNYPGYAHEEINKAGKLMNEGIGRYTGDALIDALNIFMNQLAITAFNKLMKNLAGDDTHTHPYGGDYGGLTDYEAAPRTSGIAGAKERFRELIEPRFNVRGDYNILAELTMCPDPNKAGPTNCVIEDRFREAIADRMIVGEAMKQGYLNPGGIFGFTSDGLEPRYIDQDYPYRSMIILRKFRIIPVGWEIASQYIKDFSNATVNLENLVNCFADDDDYGQPSETYDWCKGLVDPNWVLKAPLNYCKREGPGPEIISEQVIGEDYESKLSISRNDNYCADEQSCIKENNNGSCEMYGYCTEERRKWQFNGESCEPIYNTCQIFRSRDGKTASYLENTLDYSGCNMDNAGCRIYATSTISYSSSDDSVEWNSDGQPLYFDKDVEECDEDDEGCHELIRTKAGLGANLLKNSSFEKHICTVCDGTDDNFDDWGIIGAAISDSYDGLQAVQLIADLNKTIDINPAGYDIAGEPFVLSFYAKNCGTGGEFGLAGATSSLQTTNDWQFFKFSHIYPKVPPQVGVEISIAKFGGTCLIDAIKLERGITATVYSDYRGNGLVYEKLAPDYLGCTFAGGPDECDNFARFCTEPEVGCELYTEVKDNFTIPAKATVHDYCPCECAGYDDYLQSESIFDSQRLAYFIPKTAKTCGAQAAGCDEFTNLDKLGQGAEAIEYYAYLRQCRKPDGECAEFYTWEGSAETGYQLKVFSLQAEAGKPYLTDNGQYDGLDCNIEDDYDLSANPMCREFYNTAGDVFYKFYPYTVSCSSNCHPYRRTENNTVKDIISGNDISQNDCEDFSQYPDYRDINREVYLDGDPNNNQCVFCKNNGAWNSEHQRCIYMAIPGEGERCSAGQNGCRRYTGKAGSNMKVVLDNNFEGSTQGWVGIGGSAVTTSSTALMAGGESLFVSGAPHSASTTVGGLLSGNSSYVISFIAYAPVAPVNLTISFANGATSTNFSNTAAEVRADFVWHQFKIDLVEIGHDIAADESLVITGNNNFNIDDIRLTEIRDHYYLIKDSWQPPEFCSYDIVGNFVGDEKNLGCAEYRDRDNNTHCLHDFNLCKESAVGCELMIDTHNYSDYNDGWWNDGDDDDCAADGDDCVHIPADNYVYVVYDLDKECYLSSKGCQRLGQLYQYGSDVLYSDVYLKNDPDQYNNIDPDNNILCLDNEVGCEKWATTEGMDDFDYFKDPGKQVCEWRQAYGIKEGGWDWYKKKIKRCDDGGAGVGEVNGAIDVSGSGPSDYAPVEINICLNNTDCNIVFGYNNIECGKDDDCVGSGYDYCVNGFCGCKRDSDCNGSDNDYRSCANNKCHYSCITDNSDYSCPLSDFKTIGYGGPGNAIEQPGIEVVPLPDGTTKTIYWAGLCPANQAGCSEYIDPISRFSINIMYNGDFSQNIDGSLFDCNPPSGGDTDFADGWKWTKDAIECSNGVGEQDVALEANTLYILYLYAETGADAINFEVKIITTTSSGADMRIFDQPSNSIKEDTDKIVVKSSLNADQKETVSKYFYTSKAGSAVITASDATAGSNMKIHLKKAIVGYQLKQTLDRRSCIDGVVNFSEGCVLFNERIQDGGDKARLIYDANNTDDNNTPNTLICEGGECEAHPNVECPSLPSGIECSDLHNANTLLKVTPDRACNKWLACRSYVAIKNENGVKENVCFDIGLCDSVNDNGNCSNFLVTEQINQAYSISGVSVFNISQLSDMSGYVKAGFKGSPENSDYYTLAAMKQIGELAAVPNGSFEFAGSNGYPLGWIWSSGEEWDPSRFSAISGPYNAQKEGIGRAPVGSNFLKLGSTHRAISEWIDVEEITYYVITAYINTINLSDGKAKIKIAQYGTTGPPEITGGTYDVLNLDSGNEWTYVLKKFRTTANTSRLEITLYSDPDTVGNYYFDDIKLRPALDTKKLSSAEQLLTPQTCRLYPKDDSLSCDYLDDSGMRKRGSLGYCLDYDRYPGSSDNCVLWWPVDKVKGEGIEEGAGYNDRLPLYYCKLFTGRRLALVERRIGGQVAYDDCGAGSTKWCKGCGCAGDPPCPTGYRSGESSSSCSWGAGSENWYHCHVNAGGQSPCSGWWPTDGDLQSFGGNKASFNEASYGNKLCDMDTGELFDLSEFASLFYCQSLVKTVSETGANKYWSGRVYQGSNYVVPDLNYGYITPYPPYGAIVPPFPENNPYEWDAISDTEAVEPLRIKSYRKFESYAQEANAGSPYGCQGGGCTTQAGACSDSQRFCYNINIPACSGATNPVSFNNPFSCPFNETCRTGFPIGSGDGYIKRLFARSYGAWNWVGTKDDGRYEKAFSYQGPPTNACADISVPVDGIPGPRDVYFIDWCGIPPKIFNIMVNDQAVNNISVSRNQFVNLTFNSKVDGQQRPLVMYSIKWGDNENTVVTGVEMRDRPNKDDPNTADIDEGIPHSLYHMYSYWDLKAKQVVDQTVTYGENSIYCADADEEICNYLTVNTAGAPCGAGTGIFCGAGEACCAVQPKIKIKDNWGWCNNIGTDGPWPCPNEFEPFPHWIIVNNTVITSSCAASGCDGNCPVGCRAIDDPDCGGTGCCGDSICNHSDHPTLPGNEMNPLCVGPGCASAMLCGTDCSNVCTTDGVCDSTCPSAVDCAAGQDPDCDVINSLITHCCGDGECNNLTHPTPGIEDIDNCFTDCSSVCITTGDCDGMCPIGCTDIEDIDCPITMPPGPPPGCCGDFVRDIGPDGLPDTLDDVEECDYGFGNNTAIPCTPAYGSDCTYCDLACQLQTVPMTEWCGDSKLNGTEMCDIDLAIFGPPDDNDGDGCQADCTIEPGWSCDTTADPSSCGFCGDGVPNGTEVCDNDLTNTDCDGCKGDCSRHDNVCGDGIRDAGCGEVCDDGGMCKGGAGLVPCRVGRVADDCIPNGEIGPCTPMGGDGCNATCTGS